MDSLPFPRFHQPLCIASESKLIYNYLSHGYIGCMISPSCNDRGAGPTLARCPHTRPSTCPNLVPKPKWIRRNKGKCWRRRPRLRDLDPVQPFGVCRRWKRANPASKGGRVIPIGSDSWGSRARRAQWRGNWGTDRTATIHMKVCVFG